jgi:AcrR family transcriptional regulator
MPIPLEGASPEVRRQILDAALELFSGRGYFNTSVQDIRRAAGVSVGSIYHHFGSKEGIAKALYDGILEQLDRAVQQAAVGRLSCEERCRAVTLRLFELAEQEPLMVGFALNAKHREFMPEQPPICSSGPFERMRDLVRAGIIRGEILPLDPMLAAAALFGGPLRLLQLRLDGVLRQPLPKIFDTAWSCAWRAVAVNPSSR